MNQLAERYEIIVFPPPACTVRKREFTLRSRAYSLIIHNSRALAHGIRDTNLRERGNAFFEVFFMQRLYKLGKPLNELGESLNELGKPLNELGKPLNELGKPLNELGESLNELGKPLNGDERFLFQL
jgi:hypothetical protein